MAFHIGRFVTWFMDTIKPLQSAQKIIVTHDTETWNFFYYYHFVDEYDILIKNK